MAGFLIQILLEKVLSNWFLQLLARSWFRWLLFSIQILFDRVLKKLPAFGKIWVLVAAFFLFKFNRIEKLYFPAFRKIWFWWLVFCSQILIQKVLSNWFFQLLARSWFWWLLFFIQMLLGKVLNTCFFQLLARSWFWWLPLSIQILLEKYWKLVFSSFWQDLGFGGCFFLFKFLFNVYLKKIQLLLVSILLHLSFVGSSFLGLHLYWVNHLLDSTFAGFKFAVFSFCWIQGFAGFKPFCWIQL